MDSWGPTLDLKRELDRLEGGKATGLSGLELQFRRATLLHRLGRFEQAKAAYLAVLAQDPSQPACLANLGALLHETDFRSAAMVVFRRLIALQPGRALGHVGLARVLADHGDPAAARSHYEQALALEPACAEAHQGLAALLMELRDEEGALRHGSLGWEGRPLVAWPYRGTSRPTKLLVLASARGGNTPLRKALDDRLFQATVVTMEYLGEGQALPPHDLVFNAIGDADLCGGALGLAENALRGNRAPVINPPTAVGATGRAANAGRLGSLAGVRCPRTEELGRALLEAPGAADELGRRGLGFPLLLRAQGFHAGRHFVKVDDAGGLAEALQTLPGRDILAMQFLDARSPDGKIRKYRAMSIGGRLLPLHAAVSRDWKIHFFSADMGDPAHRAEDEAFLRDMPGVLGPAWPALQSVAAALGLDYAGVDFSLSPDGELLLFEANATMVILPPSPGGAWEYRREPVRRVIDAFTGLLLSRAAAA